MAFNDLTKATPKRKLKTRIIALEVIFVFLLKFGLAQTKGKANGPTHKKDTIKVEILKYHLSFRGSIFASSCFIQAKIRKDGLEKSFSGSAQQFSFRSIFYASVPR